MTIYHVVGPFSKEENQEHVQKFGGYNDPPPNWTPISMDEFWHWYSMYGLLAPREHRQFVIPEPVTNSPMDTSPICTLSSVQLFFAPGDQGYALVLDWKYAVKKGLTEITYAPRAFKFFLCEHKMYETAESWMFLHVYKCSECGLTKTVDSSG